MKDFRIDALYRPTKNIQEMIGFSEKNIPLFCVKRNPCGEETKYDFYRKDFVLVLFDVKQLSIDNSDPKVQEVSFSEVEQWLNTYGAELALDIANGIINDLKQTIKECQFEIKRINSLSGLGSNSGVLKYAQAINLLKADIQKNKKIYGIED